MKYIESLELREWVKDSLKKTIFQKAHALAVQTGCEILVKLHDTADISGCQYYATKNLRRAYKTSKLGQPGEMLVSGETGLPLMDKCIQYEDEPTEGSDGAIPVDDGGGEDGVINEAFTIDSATQNDAVPMQITAASDGHVTSSFASQTQTTQSGTESGTDVHITQVTNQRNILGVGTEVKQEPVYEQQEQTLSQGSPGMMQSMSPPAQAGLGAFSYPISPKPYQCSICRKAFKSVHVLQKHTMTFHMPGGTTISRTRGRGRGSRGSRSRGRGRGTMFSRPTLVQQPFHPPPMPAVKPEDDQNRFTCIMCNQNFEQSSQLNEHMSQCPMAPGAQGAQSDPSSSQFVTGAPSAAGGSEDSAGFSGDFPQDVPATTSSASWSFPAPDSSPSGVNVSAASASFGQQSPASAPAFGFPSQSPRAGGTGSSREKKTYTVRGAGPNFGASTAMTKQNIMGAILKSKGPAVTHRVINCSYTFLRMLTAKQFMTAATELEALGLGSVVSLKSAGRPTYVFVKQQPEEVKPILEANLDLCLPEYYESRYEMPLSKILSEGIRETLKLMGLIPHNS